MTSTPLLDYSPDARPGWLISRKHIPLLATLAVWLTLYAAACLRFNHFLSWPVLLSLLRDGSFLGIAAVGLTFVILSGGIDLSVGALLAFVSILVATLITRFNLHPALAIALALAIGAATGAFMGALIAFFGLPPFLVTLAAMFLARGMGLVVSQAGVPISHPFYDRLGDFSFNVFPVSVIILLGTFAAGFYLAHFTRFGRAVYAIGGNEQSALLMGLPVRSTRIRIYALSGFFSALAGIVFTIETKSGTATAVVMLELDAIAAVVIGGTLLTGGVGYVLGTLVGVLILIIIKTVIDWEGTLSSWWTRIATGILLLAFILLQKTLQIGGTRRNAG